MPHSPAAVRSWADRRPSFEGCEPSGRIRDRALAVSASVNRFAAPALCTVVTPLLGLYGTAWWSWLAGPAAALGLHLLQLKTEPAASPEQAPTAGALAEVQTV